LKKNTEKSVIQSVIIH